MPKNNNIQLLQAFCLDHAGSGGINLDDAQQILKSIRGLPTKFQTIIDNLSSNTGLTFPYYRVLNWNPNFNNVGHALALRIDQLDDEYFRVSILERGSGAAHYPSMPQTLKTNVRPYMSFQLKSNISSIKGFLKNIKSCRSSNELYEIFHYL